MQRITYGMIRDKMEGRPYPAELAGEDAEAVAAAVNQGIDAHLESCCIKGQDLFVWGMRPLGTKGSVRILRCNVTVASLPVLLRRLYDMSGAEFAPDDVKAAAKAEHAESICMAILDSLGIEDTGTTGFEIISPTDEPSEEERPSCKNQEPFRRGH